MDFNKKLNNLVEKFQQEAEDSNYHEMISAYDRVAEILKQEVGPKLAYNLMVKIGRLVD